MDFQLRDLLITLFPASLDHFADASPCDGGSAPPPGAPDVAGIYNELTNVEMRMILQLALTQLGGAVTLAEIQPRTVQDLSNLEDRLGKAQQAVRDLRQKMGVSTK
ncbi:MAG: hypothetical protein WCB99_07590 [Candidatus Cybelea sp.]